MRALTLALSIAGLSLPALLVGMSGPGQAQGPTFKLEVCSGWPRPVALSLVHRTAPNEQRYVVKGWFGLQQGRCGSVDLPRGNFATFAFSINNGKADKIWAGQGEQAVTICVDLSKDTFERVVTDNYQCKEENKEIEVPFQIWRVTNQPGVKVTFK